ncbi:unnamed protein product [Trichogramma brassicae]|uniref:Uncharacterized protein n=1 Tax=Trichogramma brassicae TaxID=86971 RepID=A0A6H5IHG9_9HYME|nr:unnamed protein product [Trichogramma brassicae]
MTMIPMQVSKASAGATTTYDPEEMDRINQENLKELKSMRERTNWEIEEERKQFIFDLIDLIKDWRWPLPNLHLEDILRKEEIHWLLTESMVGDLNYDGERIIDFVARTDYKDMPDVNEDGKPPSVRTTPVHHAFGHRKETWTIQYLFKIYDRFDVNYMDEFGLTHFHVACVYGLGDVVEKFLELGQDPNCLVPETAQSPLHLALNHCSRQVTELLLKYGANPNLTDKNFSTPLHIICKIQHSDVLANMLFELANDKYEPVQVDAQNKFGNTPLNLTVVSDNKIVAELLLKKGVIRI